MNEKFEHDSVLDAEQKEKLVSIKHEISLLYQQVNYLLRNEKALGILDLDVLMNRTHTLYDLLCSVNLGEEINDDDLPFDAEAFSGLFGGTVAEEENVEEEAPAEEEETVEQEPVVVEVPAEPEIEPEPEPEPDPEPEPVSEPEPESIPEPVLQPQQEVEPIVEQPVIEQPIVEEIPVEEPQLVVETQPINQVEEVPEEKAEEKPLGDEFGFLFRFEDIPEKEEQPVEDHPIVASEGKVVHVMEEIPEEEIPERDRVHGDDLVTDNPLVMPRMDEERMAEREEIGRESSEGVPDVFGNDEAEFELSTGETLGEKMMGNDNSLAAKLQQAPGRDLKSFIGINDKFLFVNELFGGSMEKYNKSIENLNDLKTLNGAMIYLNELKIELQWNSSNEAYQKLRELVSRKYE